VPALTWCGWVVPTDLLLGMGIGFTVNMAVKGETEYRLDATTVLILSLCGLLLVLLYSLTYVAVNRFRIHRPYAISLIGLYLALVVVDVAVEIAGV
jgi:Ca2+/Na+ antiporter